MKQSITQSQFIDAFHNMGRGEQFSYNGLIALYNYLEDMEQDTGEDIEFDVIALCCECTEYQDLEELQENYSNIESMEELQDNTIVIMIDSDSFIIQDF
jgi:aerobic-type carbon monoxide dehydrogenase small subunit (CoxS/CutS family)